MGIDAKLAEIGREVAYVQKDGKNDYHKYKYASAEAVLQKINEAVFSRGMSLETRASIVRANEDLSNVIVEVGIVIHDGDEVRAFGGLGQGSDKGDKAVMKATTAAHKYAYALGFCISWGDDPEADAGTDKRASGKALGGRTASKATPPKLSQDEALTLIQHAANEHILEDIRKRLQTLRSNQKVVRAFKARKEELKGKTK